MAIQKGPQADNFLGAKNPLTVDSNENQRETKNPLTYVMDSGDGKMPKITLETKQSGKIGNGTATSEGTRSPNTAQDTFGEDQNLREQWIQA